MASRHDSDEETVIFNSRDTKQVGNCLVPPVPLDSCAHSMAVDPGATSNATFTLPRHQLPSSLYQYCQPPPTMQSVIQHPSTSSSSKNFQQQSVYSAAGVPQWAQTVSIPQNYKNSHLTQSMKYTPPAVPQSVQHYYQLNSLKAAQYCQVCPPPNLTSVPKKPPYTSPTPICQPDESARLPQKTTNQIYNHPPPGYRDTHHHKEVLQDLFRTASDYKDLPRDNGPDRGDRHELEREDRHHELPKADRYIEEKSTIRYDSPPPYFHHSRKKPEIAFRGFKTRYSDQKLLKHLLFPTEGGFLTFLKLNSQYILKTGWQKEITPRQRVNAKAVSPHDNSSKHFSNELQSQLCDIIIAGKITETDEYHGVPSCGLPVVPSVQQLKHILNSFMQKQNRDKNSDSEEGSHTSCDWESDRAEDECINYQSLLYISSDSEPSEASSKFFEDSSDSGAVMTNGFSKSRPMPDPHFTEPGPSMSSSLTQATEPASTYQLYGYERWQSSSSPAPGEVSASDSDSNEEKHHRKPSPSYSVGSLLSMLKGRKEQPNNKKEEAPKPSSSGVPASNEAFEQNLDSQILQRRKSAASNDDGIDMKSSLAKQIKSRHELPKFSKVKISCPKPVGVPSKNLNNQLAVDTKGVRNEIQTQRNSSKQKESTTPNISKSKLRSNSTPEKAAFKTAETRKATEMNAESRKVESRKAELQETPTKKIDARKNPSKKTEAQKSPAKKMEAQKSMAKKVEAQESPVKKTEVQKSLAKKTEAQESLAKKIEGQTIPVDKTQAQTTSPNKTRAQTTSPNKTQAQTTSPNKTQAQTTSPSNTQAQTTSPNNTQTQTTSANKTQHQTTSPNKTQHQTTLPNKTQPQTISPNKTQPQTISPNKTQPQTTSLNKAQPQTTPTKKTQAHTSPTNKTQTQTNPDTKVQVQKTSARSPEVNVTDHKQIEQQSKEAADKEEGKKKHKAGNVVVEKVTKSGRLSEIEMDVEDRDGSRKEKKSHRKRKKKHKRENEGKSKKGKKQKVVDDDSREIATSGVTNDRDSVNNKEKESSYISDSSKTDGRPSVNMKNCENITKDSTSEEERHNNGQNCPIKHLAEQHKNNGKPPRSSQEDAREHTNSVNGLVRDENSMHSKESGKSGSRRKMSKGNDSSRKRRRTENNNLEEFACPKGHLFPSSTENDSPREKMQTENNLQELSNQRGLFSPGCMSQQMVQSTGESPAPEQLIIKQEPLDEDDSHAQLHDPRSWLIPTQNSSPSQQHQLIIPKEEPLLQPSFPSMGIPAWGSPAHSHTTPPLNPVQANPRDHVEPLNQVVSSSPEHLKPNKNPLITGFINSSHTEGSKLTGQCQKKEITLQRDPFLPESSELIKTETFQAEEYNSLPSAGKKRKAEPRMKKEKEEELKLYTRKFLGDDHASESLYSDLLKKLQTLKLDIWNEGDSVEYNWEVNLRWLMMHILKETDFWTFARNVDNYMTDYPSLDLFFNYLTL